MTAEQIYKAFDHGEIDRETMERHMGVRISETLHDHLPRPYPNPMGMVASYIEDRIGQRRDCDADLAKANGEWLSVLQKTRILNLEDVGLLNWALKNCKAIDQDTAVNKITEMLDRHSKNDFPSEQWRSGDTVQRMDSDERRHGK